MSETPMRKLPPTKTIAHAFRSVRDFAAVGIRYSLWWTALMLAIGVATLLTAEPPPTDPQTPVRMSPIELVSAIVSLLAFCSIAVNWHRFILRDEDSRKVMRLDGTVWRYIGNSLLVVIMAVAPLAVLAVALVFLPPIASALLAPGAIVAGTFAMALSLKLPAVALGRTDFGFKDAVNATQGNFWQLMGVFLINGLIALGCAFVLIAVASAVMAANFMVGAIVGLGLSMIFNVFYTLFSISVLSSLYGFFVERREF